MPRTPQRRYRPAWKQKQCEGAATGDREHANRPADYSVLNAMSYAIDLVRFAQEGLRPMLGRVLGSPSALDELAARSYAHDNGFMKIVLVSRRQAENALRLHVWPSGSGDEGNIHNHCWGFSSVVLKGRLEFEEFAVDDAGRVSAMHYAYEPSTDFEYELRPFGTTLLRPSASGRRRVGELYEMSAETLHRTWGGGATTTVTLLAQGTRRRDFADVYVTRAGGVPTEASNRPLTGDEIRPLIAEIICSLAPTPR